MAVMVHEDDACTQAPQMERFIRALLVRSKSQPQTGSRSGNDDAPTRDGITTNGVVNSTNTTNSTNTNRDDENDEHNDDDEENNSACTERDAGSALDASTGTTNAGLVLVSDNARVFAEARPKRCLAPVSAAGNAASVRRMNRAKTRWDTHNGSRRGCRSPPRPGAPAAPGGNDGPRGPPVRRGASDSFLAIPQRSWTPRPTTRKPKPRSSSSFSSPSPSGSGRRRAGTKTTQGTDTSDESGPGIPSRFPRDAPGAVFPASSAQTSCEELVEAATAIVTAAGAPSPGRETPGAGGRSSTAGVRGVPRMPDEPRAAAPRSCPAEFACTHQTKNPGPPKMPRIPPSLLVSFEEIRTLPGRTDGGSTRTVRRSPGRSHSAASSGSGAASVYSTTSAPGMSSYISYPGLRRRGRRGPAGRGTGRPEGGGDDESGGYLSRTIDAALEDAESPAPPPRRAPKRRHSRKMYTYTHAHIP